MSIRKPGSLTCWPGFQITPPTKSPTCFHGIGRRTNSPRPPSLPKRFAAAIAPAWGAGRMRTIRQPTECVATRIKPRSTARGRPNAARYPTHGYVCSCEGFRCRPLTTTPSEPGPRVELLCCLPEIDNEVIELLLIFDAGEDHLLARDKLVGIGEILLECVFVP